MKDAVQCRNCALCCHKKCVLKCQTSTTCTSIELDKLENQEFSQPEITMTDVCSDQIHEGNDTETSVYDSQFIENSNLTHCNSSLKRVNSTNSLAIPGKIKNKCTILLLYSFIHQFNI